MHGEQKGKLIYLDVLFNWHKFLLIASFSKAVRLLAFIWKYEGN
jgi:hypothetical protein